MASQPHEARVSVTSARPPAGVLASGRRGGCRLHSVTGEFHSETGARPQTCFAALSAGADARGRLDERAMDSSHGAVEQLGAASSHQVTILGPGTVVSRIRSGLRPPPDELDQVVRLARFRAAHPEVIVGDGGFGTVQA